MPAPNSAARRLVVGGLAGSLAGAGVWWFAVRERRPPWLIGMEHEVPRLEPEYGSALSPGARERLLSIWNDVLRRPHWTKDDVAALQSIVSAPLPPLPKDGGDPQQYRDAINLFTTAMDAITTRVSVGAPIDPGARALIREIMVEMLEASEPLKRMEAASFFIDTGQIEDPAIRGLVERLIDDPDKENGLTVSIMLSNYDHKKRTHAAYDAQRIEAGPGAK